MVENIKDSWGLHLKVSDMCCDLMRLHAERYHIIIWKLNYTFLVFLQRFLFTLAEVLDEELIRIHIHKHPSGCWDIYTLYPICWWVSCSQRLLFSSYVERQMCDWIYKCPQEYRAGMWIGVWWKCYIFKLVAPRTVGQPRQIPSRRLIWFMIMVCSRAEWQSFYLQPPKWNGSSHAHVTLQTQSSLRSSLSHPAAQFQTSPAPFSSLSQSAPTHLHKHTNIHNHTTLILFHHSCFLFLLPPSVTFSLLELRGCVTEYLLLGHSSPLLCFKYFDLDCSKLAPLLSFISQGPPSGFWDLEEQIERKSGEYLTVVVLDWCLWTQRVAIRWLNY